MCIKKRPDREAESRAPHNLPCEKKGSTVAAVPRRHSRPTGTRTTPTPPLSDPRKENKAYCPSSQTKVMADSFSLFSLSASPSPSSPSINLHHHHNLNLHNLHRHRPDPHLPPSAPSPFTCHQLHTGDSEPSQPSATVASQHHHPKLNSSHLASTVAIGLALDGLPTTRKPRKWFD